MTESQKPKVKEVLDGIVLDAIKRMGPELGVFVPLQIQPETFVGRVYAAGNINPFLLRTSLAELGGDIDIISEARHLLDEGPRASLIVYNTFSNLGPGSDIGKLRLEATRRVLELQSLGGTEIEGIESIRDHFVLSYTAPQPNQDLTLRWYIGYGYLKVN